MISFFSRSCSSSKCFFNSCNCCCCNLWKYSSSLRASNLPNAPPASRIEPPVPPPLPAPRPNSSPGYIRIHPIDKGFRNVMGSLSTTFKF
ncbi:unnamed protein product [Schistosoma margrebowiei]|uniref:Uncharacterized protein n=1 Tax=Schistosoma margrebowiei TaxID=48269 RepID=A0A3P8AXG5_9TREM|nr:unnamed protein product [Schistosoma margrebowiei]